MGDAILPLLIIGIVVIAGLVVRARNQREDQFRAVVSDLSFNAAVAEYVQRNYRIQFRTEASAQLVKPKEFSFGWALLWFLVFGIGLVVYLLYYASKPDTTVYLERADDGTTLIR